MTGRANNHTDLVSSADWHAMIADEGGGTAIEYALIASAISIALAATIFLIGPQIVTIFEDIIAAWP